MSGSWTGTFFLFCFLCYLRTPYRELWKLIRLWFQTKLASSLFFLFFFWKALWYATLSASSSLLFIGRQECSCPVYCEIDINEIDLYNTRLFYPPLVLYVATGIAAAGGIAFFREINKQKSRFISPVGCLAPHQDIQDSSIKGGRIFIEFFISGSSHLYLNSCISICGNVHT